MITKENHIFPIALTVDYVEDKNNIEYFKYVVHRREMHLTVNDLLMYLKQGYIISNVFSEDDFYLSEMNDETFKKCGVLFFNINKNIYSINEIKEKLRFKPTFIIESFSSNEIAHSYHLYYVLDKPIENIDVFKIIYNKLKWEFKKTLGDNIISDIDNVAVLSLYGNPKPNINTIVTNNIYQIDDFNSLEEHIKSTPILHRKVGLKHHGRK